MCITHTQNVQRNAPLGSSRRRWLVSALRIEGKDTAQNMHCTGCGSHMKHPTLYTADAGQAYEIIDTKLIAESVDTVFPMCSKVLKCRDPTVSVMHTVRRKTAPGGRIDDPAQDRTVYFSSKSKICIKGLLNMRTYKLGNLFLQQTQCIPIGGLVPGAVLDTVLGKSKTNLTDLFGRLSV